VLGSSVALAWASLSWAEAALDARLVEPDRNAMQASATLEVEVSGLELIDPATAMERPQTGQGHVHYRVDAGPVIATTATKLSFHELSAGVHRFRVELVGNDHQPLGPSESLEITVPVRTGAAH
jgi:hypothetical protein